MTWYIFAAICDPGRYLAGCDRDGVIWTDDPDRAMKIAGAVPALRALASLPAVVEAVEAPPRLPSALTQ